MKNSFINLFGRGENDAVITLSNLIITDYTLIKSTVVNITRNVQKFAEWSHTICFKEYYKTLTI